MIKNITAFIPPAKTVFRKEFGGLYLTPTHVAATDGHRLIEVAHATSVATPCIVTVPKNLKTFDTIAACAQGEVLINHRGATYPTVLIDAKYPTYETIFPKEKAPFTVRVNARYLKDMATAFESTPDATLDIAYHGVNRPLVFSEETKTVRGLLMPVTR